MREGERGGGAATRMMQGRESRQSISRCPSTSGPLPDFLLSLSPLTQPFVNTGSSPLQVLLPSNHCPPRLRPTAANGALDQWTWTHTHTSLLISCGCCKSFPVSRCGPVVRRLAGKQKDLGSIRFGFPFSSLQINVVYGTLSCDFAHTINENIKMAHTTAHFNAESLWW